MSLTELDAEDRPAHRSATSEATPDSPPRPRGRHGRRHRLLQAPSLIVLGLVAVFPLLYSVNLSVRRYSPILPDGDGRWAGLSNFSRLLHDSQFGRALVVTVIFIVCAVALETVIGLFVGAYLHRLAHAHRLVTTVLLLPMIATPLVVGLMFSFALNAQFGYLTWALQGLGIAGADGLLSNPNSALAVLIMVDVWEWVPFIALMVIAGLRSLPQSPVEAARIDGCSAPQIYRYVILPMLRPVLAVAVLFRATEAVREFDKVYVLTGGGPGTATTVNDLFQYKTAFATFDLSYGAALGLVSFVAVLVVSAVTFRFITRSGEYR